MKTINHIRKYSLLGALICIKTADFTFKLFRILPIIIIVVLFVKYGISVAFMGIAIMFVIRMMFRLAFRLLAILLPFIVLALILGLLFII